MSKLLNQLLVKLGSEHVCLKFKAQNTSSFHVTYEFSCVTKYVWNYFHCYLVTIINALGGLYDHLLHNNCIDYKYLG